MRNVLQVFALGLMPDNVGATGAAAAAAAAASAADGLDFDAEAALLRGAASEVLRDMIARQDAALRELLAQGDHFSKVHRTP